jgi:hypothetical protein
VKFQDASKTVNIIFGGDGDFGCRQEQKLLLQEIMSVEPAAPRPLRWSEVPISFSCDDQWTSFSELGKFPLVLDPVVAEVRLTKVLIDGGSGPNLIFASTLRKMGLDFTDMLVQASLLSTASSQVMRRTHSARWFFQSPSALGRTTTPSSLNSKLLTSNLLIMPYLVVRHSPNSWQCHIMFICFLRCQDKVGYSLSEAT